jgi:tellurite resistance protein TerC
MLLSVDDSCPAIAVLYAGCLPTTLCLSPLPVNVFTRDYLRWQLATAFLDCYHQPTRRGVLVFDRLLENKSYKLIRKLIIALVGLSVLLVGAAMIVLPGPAILVIPTGLAILATEFAWARILLNRVKEKMGWKTNSGVNLV